MPLSDQEKERVRYHMGYLGVGIGPSMQQGVPRPVQTLFLLEQAMSNLMEVSLPRVRAILSVMDGIEQKLVDGLDRLAATQLDELHLNGKETEQLENEYGRWGFRLADIMGAPLYPFSARYSGRGGASTAGSIPINRPRY